jgi:hypothetical protein
MRIYNIIYIIRFIYKNSLLKLETERIFIMEKQELEWGQTPFDTMTHEELLLNAKRMFSAVRSARAELNLFKEGSTNEFYWGINGSGGKTLEKLNQSLNPIYELYSPADIHSSFYRYADDLLFDSDIYKIGNNWHVCPNCGIMISGRGVDYTNKTCKNVIIGGQQCDVLIKPINWEDLKPSEK